MMNNSEDFNKFLTKEGLDREDDDDNDDTNETQVETIVSMVNTNIGDKDEIIKSLKEEVDQLNRELKDKKEKMIFS